MRALIFCCSCFLCGVFESRCGCWCECCNYGFRGRVDESKITCKIDMLKDKKVQIVENCLKVAKQIVKFEKGKFKLNEKVERGCKEIMEKKKLKQYRSEKWRIWGKFNGRKFTFTDFGDDPYCAISENYLKESDDDKTFVNDVFCLKKGDLEKLNYKVIVLIKANDDGVFTYSIWGIGDDEGYKCLLRSFPKDGSKAIFIGVFPCVCCRNYPNGMCFGFCDV